MTITTDRGAGAPVDRFIETPRYRVHLVEAGSGHPVVLLHGGGPGATGSSNFAGNIGPLAEHFRVLAPDMPGWGESDPSTEGGRDHVDVLIGILDALGIERAALVGNSVGGITAISAAVAHPDRVSHLVVMGAPAPILPLLSPGGGPTEGMRALIAAYDDPTPERLAAFVRALCFDPGFASDELARARSAAARAYPEHISNWKQSRVGGPSPYFQLGERIAEITAPTMAVHGRDDRVVHFEHSLALTSRIADSRMVLLNRCGHWAQLEHAEEFNTLVTAFVGTE